MAADRQLLVVRRPSDRRVDVGEPATARLVPAPHFGGDVFGHFLTLVSFHNKQSGHSINPFPSDTRRPAPLRRGDESGAESNPSQRWSAGAGQATGQRVLQCSPSRPVRQNRAIEEESVELIVTAQEER